MTDLIRIETGAGWFASSTRSADRSTEEFVTNFYIEWTEYTELKNYL